MNWQSNSSLSPTGYGNDLRTLSPVRPDGESSVLFTPEGDRFVGDLELHFDADRLLMSMPGDKGRARVWELGLKSDALGNLPLHQLPLIDEPDVDNYDACYLPNDDVIFTSTAPFVGVP